MEYAVVFEKAPRNWAAYVPDLPGCIAAGKTLDETRALITEAIGLHIESLREQGLRVPKPRTRVEGIPVAEVA